MYFTNTIEAMVMMDKLKIARLCIYGFKKFSQLKIIEDSQW